MGTHEKPAPPPSTPSGPPGNGDGVPPDVAKPGSGDHKKR